MTSVVAGSCSRLRSGLKSSALPPVSRPAGDRRCRGTRGLCDARRPNSPGCPSWQTINSVFRSEPFLAADTPSVDSGRADPVKLTLLSIG
jgi:hypothetical protein